MDTDFQQFFCFVCSLVVIMWLVYFYCQAQPEQEEEEKEQKHKVTGTDKEIKPLFYCTYCTEGIAYHPYVFRDNVVCQKCHTFHSGDMAKKYRMSCARAFLNSVLEKRGHFSVCDLRDWSELLRINIPKSIESFLTNYHCIHWDVMTNDEITTIKSHVLSYLDMFEEYNYLVKEHNKKVEENNKKTEKREKAYQEAVKKRKEKIEELKERVRKAKEEGRTIRVDITDFL